MALTRLDEPTRERFRVGVLLVTGVLAIWILVRLLAPVGPGLVIAGVLAVLARPAYPWVEARVGNRNLAALLGTAAIFFLLLLPFAGLSYLLVQELREGASLVEDHVLRLIESEGAVQRWIGSVAELLDVDPARITQGAREEMRNLAGFLAGGTLGLLSGLGGWLLQAGVAVFTLFYLLRDGKAFLAALRWILPLADEITDQLVRRTGEIIDATLYGMILVALVQGLLGGVAFWLLGLPAATFWGATMALMSLLPVLGPPVVWVPAVLILLAGGEIARALILVMVGALLVGTVDNYLRAVFVSGRAHLHPLVVFLSVLGALAAFGPVGILLGPILFVLAVSFVEVARLAIGPDAPVPEPGQFLLGRITTRDDEETSGEGAGT